MLRVILSFDDGRKDNYRAAMEIMKPLDIPATFNITTGYILQNIADNDKPGPHAPMNLDELNELAACELFEIAGHGYTHDNDIENLLNGVLVLRKLLPNAKINGVASPHSEFKLSDLKIAQEKFNENGIRYLRISNDYTKMSQTKIWLRRLNRVLHLSSLYAWVNEDSIEIEAKFLLHSFPVIRDNKLREVKKLINRLRENSLDSDSVCILMLHSILKPGEDYYNDLFSWDYDDFFNLCKYLSEQLKKGNILMCRTNDLFKES